MNKRVNVYKEFQLAQFNGEFTTEHKKIVRDRAVVTVQYAETINRNHKDNGRYFELDKEASEQYHLESEDENKRRVELKKLKSVTQGNVLSDIINSAIENAGNLPKEEKRGRKAKESKMEDVD